MIVRHDDSPCGSMLQGGPESATTWLIFGETAQTMTSVSDILPNDVEALRALLATKLADHATLVAERDGLRKRQETQSRSPRLVSQSDRRTPSAPQESPARAPWRSCG
jgi:hypothetical protein